MHRASVLICVALMTACTGSPAAGPRTAVSPSALATANDVVATPTPASPRPTRAPVVASPVKAGVDVDIDSVAGVGIGLPAADAERQLSRALGKPVKTPLPGCYGEKGHFLTWDTLTVYLSDSATGPVVLSGWTVQPGPTRWRWLLPYGVDLGDSIRSVLTAVPEAKGGTPTDFGPGAPYVVHTTLVPGLTWTSTTDDSSGRVADVAYNGEGCD